ncbi:hypothetical protein F4779DRAFT_97597 [Xylariaceae sp. FL0662B]|nr:hypothetical protein F4779DRAFT_97597 [Xylariaceae sp. FL0662B]
MSTPSVDLWQVPAGLPPSGLQSNLVDPPTQAPVLRTGIYVLLPLMISFFLIRIYTRTRLTHTLGIDDYLCVMALAGTLAHSGVLLAILNLKPLSPLGRHTWDIPVAAYSNSYTGLVILALTTYPLVAVLVKLTILALYHRLFRPSVWAKRLIWLGIAVTTVFYAITIIVLLSLCVPRSPDTWLLKVSSGACPAVQVRISLAHGIFGLISDLYILAIPIWQVSGLSIAPKRKVGILIVFLTGLLAIASSAGGLATREQVTLEDPNFLTTPYLFGVGELSIGLICSCMPVITVPLKSLVERTMSSWSSIKKVLAKSILSDRAQYLSAFQRAP